MKRWSAIVGALLAMIVPGLVIAQSGRHTNPLVNDVWTYFGPTLGSGWGLPAGGGGGGGTPGGSSGTIQFNNGGVFGGFHVSGDISIDTTTGVTTINPNAVTTPKIADGAVSGAKLGGGAASSNIGTVGGVLTGTLPNPGMTASGITAGSYVCPTVTFDASGRATTATAGTCGSGSGSVTSVSMAVPASSLFSVTGSPITTAGTLNLFTAGSSGGIPYFSSTSALSSSGTLPVNGFLLGGGAGGLPTGTQLTGLVKGNGASAPAAAVVGSDYAAATTGAANTPLFNNGTGGFTNGTRSGNTTTVGTTSGTLTSGNVAQFDASGNIVAGAGPGVTGSSLTANRVIIGAGSSGVSALGSAGTTTTLLHGNAAGAPTFGAASLTADVSGILASANGGTGINNGSSTITLGGAITLPAAPASTQCLHMSSGGAVTATGFDCGSGVTQAATSATVTAAQWNSWQVFDVQASGQTLTLPIVTSLSTNGGLVIKTRANSVTLAPNAADGINGGTVGASVTIPANFVTVVTTSGTSGTTALSAPLGLVQGTNITLTQNSNGTTTVASSGGSGTIIANSIGGLTLSNDGTTPLTVLDMAAGNATDSTNAVVISPGAFTKSLSTWASGTGNGGMGSGGGGLTASANTWYHVCLANNGGTPDYFFDTDVACSTHRPAAISDTKVRRIGSIKLNASVQIIPFIQRGDTFNWTAGQTDANNQSYTTSVTNVTLSTPPGVASEARITVFINTSGSALILLVYNPDTSSSPAGFAQCAESQSATVSPCGILPIMTNTSAQVAVATSSGTISATYINTLGYRDFRGT